MSESAYGPLVVYQREGLTEITIFGAVSVFSRGQVIRQIGGDPLLYGRSLLKPYQMKPIVGDLRDLSMRARALTVASHNAEAFHLQALDEIANTSGRSPGANVWQHWQLPEALPLMPLGRSGLVPQKHSHPCSGKHSAILRASRKRGWPVESYLSASHPYHEAYLKSLRAVLGSEWQPKQTAVDGCGLPTPSFRLSELAHLYAALNEHRGDDWMWSAMTEHPEMVGGTDRLDTNLMKLNPSRVLAKEGADGLLGLSFEHEGHGVGVAIKIAHGHDPRASGAVAGQILKSFGLLAPSSEAPHGQTLKVVGA